MALKRVCDITGSDRDVEICDVAIAGQAIKLDLSPAGAARLREFFGSVVTVQHPLAASTVDDEIPEPAVDEPQEGVEAQAPATPASARRPARRTARTVAGKSGRKKPAAGRGGEPVAPGSSEIREWARANGFEVRDRGAIPGRVRSAYALAHE
jgi:hypothetical protein